MVLGKTEVRTVTVKKAPLHDEQNLGHKRRAMHFMCFVLHKINMVILCS